MCLSNPSYHQIPRYSLRGFFSPQNHTNRRNSPQDKILASKYLPSLDPQLNYVCTATPDWFAKQVRNEMMVTEIKTVNKLLNLPESDGLEALKNEVVPNKSGKQIRVSDILKDAIHNRFKYPSKKKKKFRRAQARMVEVCAEALEAEAAKLRLILQRKEALHAGRMASQLDTTMPPSGITPETILSADDFDESSSGSSTSHWILILVLGIGILGIILFFVYLYKKRRLAFQAVTT